MLYNFLGSSVSKESPSQQHHDVPATVAKQSRPPISSHASTPPTSSPGVHQSSTNSNSGSSSAHRTPPAPTHHLNAPSTSSLAAPVSAQSSLATLLGNFEYH